MTTFPSKLRVAVIGAGIIGLSIAYELAIRRGVRVTLYDKRAPGRGASWAAAGMIAPAFEAAAEPGAHPKLFELCMASAALWPAFAESLSSGAGMPVGLDQAPSLAVALDEAQRARLQRISGALAARGVVHEQLSVNALLQREPALTRDVLGGLELETDFRVHNRQVVTALLKALQASSRLTFVPGAARIKSVSGSLVLEGHDAIVVAAGWETPVVKVEEKGELYSLVNWDTALGGIDCHGGQMLSVAAGAGAPYRLVRAGHVYLVPRAGEVVIGATMEPGRVIDAPEPEALEALRQESIRICPGLASAPAVERWAGVRPGTPDHAPFIGAAATPGLFVAAGHYRNGILLAPITARIIADQVLGENAGELAHGFSIHRFFTATA